jgi:hypothetical protein
MKTADGFGVSFTMSRRQAKVLGDALASGSRETAQVRAN